MKKFFNAIIILAASIILIPLAQFFMFLITPMLVITIVADIIMNEEG